MTTTEVTPLSLELKAGGEGKARLTSRSNSDGFRDREHLKEKPPNTLRIAVLGDSYVEAMQVAMGDTFWAIMEKRLQGDAAFFPKKVEVLSFGVAGYGTAQELLMLRQKVWAYSPDIVVLAFVTGNDLTDNSKNLRDDDTLPYFVYRNGTLTLDTSFRDSLGPRLKSRLFRKAYGWVKRRSRLLQVVNEAGYALKSKKRANTTVAPDQSREAGLNENSYLEPYTEVWKNAWNVSEDLIVLINEEVKEHGADFLVVTFSSGIQVYPDPVIRQKFAERLGVKNLFYPDSRIAALCARYGIAILNLAPVLQEYAEEHKVFLHGFGSRPGFGHWNILGHHVAGDLISQKLSTLALDRRPRP